MMDERLSIIRPPSQQSARYIIHYNLIGPTTGMGVARERGEKERERQEEEMTLFESYSNSISHTSSCFVNEERERERTTGVD